MKPSLALAKFTVARNLCSIAFYCLEHPNVRDSARIKRRIRLGAPVSGVSHSNNARPKLFTGRKQKKKTEKRRLYSFAHVFQCRKVTIGISMSYNRCSRVSKPPSADWPFKFYIVHLHVKRPSKVKFRESTSQLTNTCTDPYSAASKRLQQLHNTHLNYLLHTRTHRETRPT